MNMYTIKVRLGSLCKCYQPFKLFKAIDEMVVCYPYIRVELKATKGYKFDSRWQFDG